MFRSGKIWTLLATLAMLMPVTIVCDVPALDDVFDDLDFEVYYDDDYHGHHSDCWFRCDDEWFFDLDWWW